MYVQLISISLHLEVDYFEQGASFGQAPIAESWSCLMLLFMLLLKNVSYFYTLASYNEGENRVCNLQSSLNESLLLYEGIGPQTDRLQVQEEKVEKRHLSQTGNKLLHLECYVC